MVVGDPNQGEHIVNRHSEGGGGVRAIGNVGSTADKGGWGQRGPQTGNEQITCNPSGTQYITSAAPTLI